ncbi:DIS3-like exonuclease 2 isoform X2 [Scylla paramamosain]
MANGEGGGSSSSSSSRRTTPPPRSGPATPSGTPTRHPPTGHPSRKPLPVFNSYMSLFQVQEKLKKGEVIEGVLRINPKNYEDAYISAPDGGMDIYIGGVLDRNAALHGDVVAVELCPSQQWKVLYDVLDEYLDNNPSQQALLQQPQQQQQQQQQHNITLTNITTTTNNNNTHTSTASSATTTTTTTIIAATTTTTTTTTSATTTTTAAAAASYNRSMARSQKLTIAEKLSSSLTCKDSLSSSIVHKPVAARGEAVGRCRGEDLLQGDSDVLVEGEEEEEEKSKANKRRKKRGGRGKKKGKKKDEVGGGTEEEVEELSTCLPSLSLASPQDHLLLLPGQDFSLPSSSLPTERTGEEEENEEEAGESDSAGVGRAVPPDQLSECESTDNESGTSEVLDYEQCREDQAFFQAQWQAYYGSQGTETPSGDGATAGGAQDNSRATEKGAGAMGSEKTNSTDKCIVTASPCIVSEVSATVPQAKAAGTSVEAKCGAETAKWPARRKNKQGKKEGKDKATANHVIPAQHYSINMAVTRGRGGHSRQGSGTPQHRRGPQPHSTPKKQTQPRTEPTVAQVSILDNWEKFVQRTGRVVYIFDRKHPRLAAGTLRPFPDRNPMHALFAPTDHRVPRMRIPYSQLPADFLARHNDVYQHKIFLCRIVLWAEPKYAIGEVVKEVGSVGDIAAETEVLLLEHGVETEEFPQEAVKELPSLPWAIPEEELAVRTDLRDQCIFTIDPETARDLDDALSCTVLPCGDLRVGVHIADVTFFVREGSTLDQVAARRATSVYMPDRVVPMLPRGLCEGLCSLLPGTDRLAMSVVWQLSPDGRVSSEWFGRTVIRSCAKLTYEQAQQVIDSGGSAEGLPAVEVPHSAAAVAAVVWQLHGLAQKLRRGRFEGGALHLYQPKLCFTMDWSTGQPLSLAQPQGPDHSHHLVEELMLLANMAAAQRTHEAFPSQCVLRRHPPPLAGPMEAVLRALAAAGVVLDGSSAGALQASLAGHRGATALAVAALCSKPMQFARYFAPGAEDTTATPGLAHHYALNVALYTHFTSPIRRYADVLVHRLLAATLQPPAAMPTLAAARLGRACDHCNDRKRAAKSVQEASGELHLGLLVRQVGELLQPAAVVQVLDRSFDAVLLHLGLVRRVYTDPLPLTSMAFTKQDGQAYLTLHWRPEAGRPACTQRVTLLSTVQVVLRPADNTTLKFQTVLLRPE